jgi:hypothetical protein
MDSATAQTWFQGYLAEYAACGRGERIERLIEHYGVPLLLTSDAGVEHVLSEAQVADGIQRQIYGYVPSAITGAPSSSCP